MNENDSGRIYHIIRDGMVRMAVKGRELKDTDIVESVDEPDSRAWIEADVHRWLTSHVAVSVYTKDVESEVCKWLDRQAAITKRDTLHDNPTRSGSSTCEANRPISESADRETPDTTGIGASKDEIRDFDVWSVAYEIYCAGGYVDNGNEPNPPTDGIRELLDRQAAITEREHPGLTISDDESLINWHGKNYLLQSKVLNAERERDEFSLKLKHEMELNRNNRNALDLERIAEMQAIIDELTAERDVWKTKCETREVAYKQANAEGKRYSEQIDKLQAERDALADDLAECMEERDYWKQEVQYCMDAAYPPSHAPERPYDPRVMAYPDREGCTTPSTLVSAMIDGLRDDVRDTVMPIVEESVKAKAECERWRDACGSMMDAAHEIERIMREFEEK